MVVFISRAVGSCSTAGRVAPTDGVSRCPLPEIDWGRGACCCCCCCVASGRIDSSRHCNCHCCCRRTADVFERGRRGTFAHLKRSCPVCTCTQWWAEGPRRAWGEGAERRRRVHSARSPSAQAERKDAGLYNSVVALKQRLPPIGRGCATGGPVKGAAMLPSPEPRRELVVGLRRRALRGAVCLLELALEKAAQLPRANLEGGGAQKGGMAPPLHRAQRRAPMGIARTHLRHVLDAFCCFPDALGHGG